MSYEKQNWATGDIITADKLNHMEEGIYAAGGATGLITSSDGFQTIDQSYNDIVAMAEAGLIPHFFYSDSGAMYYLNVVQETDYGEGQIYFEAYFTHAAEDERMSYQASDPSVPMEIANVQDETSDG